MILTLILLSILAATVAALPRGERSTGILAALAALITATLLAVTEAGFCMTPNGWLMGVALTLGALSLLGVVKNDTDPDREELR